MGSEVSILRKHELEIDDPREIEEILRRGRLLHLALSQGDTPYCLTVCYGFVPGFLYFHSAQEGRKIHILNKNPRVFFQVVIETAIREAELSCGWSVQYRSVAGGGTARFLKEEREKARALDILMRQYSAKQYRHPPETLERTAVIEIAIESLSGKKSRPGNRGELLPLL
ncbi:MAG TPA: pyridoxamine 5'-phosphate oxidase family protein [Atribacteraceae bacterium]|nr:pyridoxamine 5'-phosphate oxidase family protein [Atribacteraceae bacterium]